MQGEYEVTYEEFDGGHTIPEAIAEGALDWWLGTDTSNQAIPTGLTSDSN